MWRGLIEDYTVGPALVVVTTNVKDHFNKLGRMAPMKPGNRGVVSCSVCSTVHTNFNGIIFIVGRTVSGRFGRTVNGTVTTRIPIRCICRRLRTLPSKCAIPRKHRGP